MFHLVSFLILILVKIQRQVVQPDNCTTVKRKPDDLYGNPQARNWPCKKQARNDGTPKGTERNLANTKH